MPIERIVIDANIVVAALLKNRTTRKMLLEEKKPLLFAPLFIKQELFKYLPQFSQRLKVAEKELREAMQQLFDLAKIEILPEKEYSTQMREALQISPDRKDAPYFAIALKLRCPIWSQDKAMKTQSKIKVHSTAELIQELEVNKK